MSAESSLLASLAVSGTTVAVLLLSLVLLNRLRKWGGLERALAHAVLHRPSRRMFLVGISTLAGTFVALGAANVAANLDLLSDTSADALTTSIFCAGAAALLLMIWNGFQVSRLSLEDELNLRDYEPGVYRALTELEPEPQELPTTLYVGPSFQMGPALDLPWAPKGLR